MVSEIQLPITLDNRYVLTKLIDSGSTSKIYFGTDTRLERNIAVKVLSPNIEDEENFSKRFKHEAQSVAKINHPNIVSVYDWGTQDNRPYIVMEYVKGQTLKTYLQENKPLPFEEIIRIMNETAAAILTAHDNGIIHRDIKPSNILITENKQVKVADFGIARSTENPDQTQVGTVLGTAAYFSPEQATGKKATIKSDIYSLGILLYELIVGKPPFKGENAVATALAHVKQSVPDIKQLRSDTPQSLIDIVTICLKKDPQDRYDNINELRKDLIQVSRSDLTDSTATAILAPIPVADEDATTVMKPLQDDKVDLDDIEEDEDDEYSTGEFDFSSNKTSKFALIALAVIVGIGILSMIVLAIMNSGEDKNLGPSKVPNVIGMQYNVAREKLELAGFKVKRINEINTSIPEGEVFEQDTEPGTSLRRDNPITLTVSAGLGSTKVPNVVGKNKDDAERILTDEGLKVKIVEESSETVAKDLVIKTSPIAGKKIKRGNEVTVTVSSGPEGVLVPDVVGKDASSASNILGQLEFTTKTIKENSSTVAEGVVIKTDPVANTKVKSGSTITVYVSSGPQQDTVPELIGLTSSQAITILQQAGFHVNLQTITSTAAQNGLVISQNPQGGTDSNVGTEVTIFVGSGPTSTSTT